MKGREKPPEVRLDPLPGERFPAFRAHLETHYARDKVDSGAWSLAEAPRRAAAELDGLLPQETDTRDHFLFYVVDTVTHEEVGTVWIHVRDQGSGRVVWIYDLEVFDRFRRRGYATRILAAVEDKARELGADRVELHVFGHNAAARRLYERSGYEPTSISMSKRIDLR
jgi:RimJ/RimL family protein N-acetyltransferase